MNKVCAPGAVVPGIDIYHGDMISDITKVAGAVKYAFLKATEGENYVDTRFKARWAQVKTAGLIRGAYHFFHPAKSPVTQAHAFLDAVGPIGPGDLPLVLDWESTDGLPSTSDRLSAMRFLSIVETATKKIPIIYSSPYFLQALSLDAAFHRYPLWIAHYGVKCPLVPPPWKTWTFWQSSETSAVPGIQGHCDFDVFNGSLDELKALTLAQE